MLRYLFALFATLCLAPSAFAQNMVEKYQLGTDYFAIEPVQPTAGDKIEVTEVFSYACIHCAHFQGVVDGWRKRMPAAASFSYMPAAWNPGWELMARAYYAAEALGILDKTHQAFYDALHVEHKPFANLDDIAQWHAAKAGIKAEDFIAAASSSAVNIKVNRSKQMVPRYGIDGTPSVVVAGKYRVTGPAAGGLEQMFEIVDFLVAKEIAARGGKAG
jgi:thiol:disulfide interchange protein DsbA